MKAFLLLAAVGFGTILLASPVRAQSPDPAKNLSQVKALLDDLLKQTNADPAEKTPKPSPAPPAQPAPAPSQDISPETLTQIQKLLNQLLKPAPQAQPAKTQSQDVSPETLTQIQKLLNQLMKNLKAETDTDPQDPPAPNEQMPAPPANSTSLTTPTLNSAHLAPSGPLDAHGTKGGTPRLSDSDWRQLFSSKQK